MKKSILFIIVFLLLISLASALYTDFAYVKGYKQNVYYAWDEVQNTRALNGTLPEDIPNGGNPLIYGGWGTSGTPDAIYNTDTGYFTESQSTFVNALNISLQGKPTDLVFHFGLNDTTGLCETSFRWAFLINYYKCQPV